MRKLHGVATPGAAFRFISRLFTLVAAAALLLSAVSAQAVTTLSGNAWQSAYVGWPTNGAFTVSWTGSDLDFLMEAQTAPSMQAAATNKVFYSTPAGSRSFSVTGKAPGVYYYTAASGGCPFSGTCAVSNDIAVIVYNNVPAISSWATAYAGNALPISWATIAPATSYQLEQQVNGGAWTTVYQGASSSYTTPALATGTYNFRVHPCYVYICEVGLYSSFTTTVISPPTLTNTNWQSVYVGYPTNGTFPITWSGGDLTWMLESQIAPRGQAGATSPVDYSIAAGTSSFNVAGKAPGVYYYLGVAGNCYNCTGTNNVAMVVYNSVPTISSWSTAYTGNTLPINWTTVSPANAYWLEQQANGGAWTTIYTGAAASYTTPALTAGTYNYRVHACVYAACAQFTSATFTVNVIAPPTLTNTNWQSVYVGYPTNGTFPITWSGGNLTWMLESQAAPRGQAGATSPVDYSIAAGTSSFSVAGKAPGVYYYNGVAGNCYNCTGTNNVAVIVYNAVPVMAAPASNSGGNFTLSWNTLSPANGYWLEQQINGGAWTSLYSGSANSYVVSGAASANYNFRVHACVNSTCAPFASAPVATTVYPATPTLSVPTTSATGTYSVTWNSVASATSYQVDQSLNYGPWTTIYTAGGTGTSLFGMADGFYQYQVRACSALGCSANSAVKSISVAQTPVTPTLSTPGTNGTGQFAPTWTTSPIASSYQLDQRFNGGTWATVLNGNATAYPQTGLATGTYDFQVRACNANGCSPSSVIATTTVTATNTVAGVSQVPVSFGTVVATLNSTAINSSDQIGTTPGSFTVDKTGASKYSIPIIAVPGTAGATPKLSLDYDSSGGNGLFGVGWSIGGLSEITRCRQNKLQDGQNKPITWSGDDRFCLDGQRLISVGVVYKKEIDDGDIIIAYGGVAGAPNYFRVQHKDGSYSFYGDAPTSRDPNGTAPLANTSPFDGKVIANNDASKVYTWKLRKTQDSAGNPTWYQHGWWYGHAIMEVRYAYGPNAGPDNYGARITFSYTGRPDTFDTGYVGGLSGFGNGLRVSQIASENAGTAVRTYNLSYLEQPTAAYTGPSHLSAVQECGLNNVCRTNLTQFDWQLPTVGFTAVAPITRPFGNLYSGSFADINGDGCIDSVWTVNGAFRYALGNCQINSQGQAVGLSFTPATFSKGASVSSETFISPQVLFGDFNHDGHADVAVFDNTQFSNRYIYIHYAEPQTDGTWKLAEAYAAKIYMAPPASYNGIPFAYISSPFLTDLNGDGLTDIVFGSFPYNGSIFYYNGIGVMYGQVDTGQTGSSSQPYNFAAQQTIIADGCNLPPNPYNGGTGTQVAPIGDTNGDGQVDLLINIDTSSQSVGAIETTGSTSAPFGCWSTGHSGWAYTAGGLAVGGVDQNGDGITDVGLRDINMLFGGWYKSFELSTGTGLLAAQNVVTGTHPLTLGDPNGDGYIDAIDALSAQITLWNPTTQSYNTTASATLAANSVGPQTQAIDINGDGILDLLYLYAGANSSAFNVQFGLGSNQPREVITKITDGLGAVTQINYENIQNSTHYQKLNVGAPPPPTPASTSPCAPASSYPCTMQWSGQSYIKSNIADYYTAMNQGFDPFSFQQSVGKQAPISELTGPKWVVASVDKSLPSTASNSMTLGGVNAAALHRTSYYYGEGKVENSIRGFLGFQTIKVVDEATGLQTITRYRQDFPFIGKAFAEDVYTGTNQLVSSTSMWWAFQNWGSTLAAPYLVTPEPAIVYKGMYNPDVAGNPLLGSQTTTNTFDANLSKVTAQVDAKDAGGNVVASVLTQNTYAADNRDYLGLPSTVVVQSSRAGQPTLTRTFAFNYYCFDNIVCPAGWTPNWSGLLYQKIIEPNKAAYNATTQYSYDNFGNPIQAVVSGTDIVSRTSSFAYDVRPGAVKLGRFLDRTTNGLNQVVSAVATRNALGQPIQVNGLNNASVQYGYGPLGRQYLEYHNDGSYMTTLRYTGFIGCVGDTAMADYAATSGGGSRVTCYDIVGRPARVSNTSFASGSVGRFVDTEYDLAGRVHHVTEPYYSNASVNGYATTNYDNVGRVGGVYTPDRALTTVSYNGLTTTTTNPAGQTKVEVKNLLGELSTVTDYLSGVVRYAYDAEGHPLTVTTSGSTQATGVPSSIVVTYAYDDVGRKKTMADPDKGTWNYSYDVLGELVAQTDAKGQVISVPTPNGYDALGRMLQRIDKKAGGTVEEATTWTYDTATNGVGQVASVQQAVSGYTRIYNYDWLGRANGESITLPTEGTHYNVVRYFDQFGREYQAFDASGSGIQRSFNAQGYFSQANDISSTLSLGGELYAVLGMDAAGRVTSDRLGGVVSGGVALIGRTHNFDVMGRPTAIQSTSGITLQNLAYSYYPLGDSQYGNLKQRQDLAKGLTETYIYDGLNRLTNSQVTAQAAATVSYDSFGNIMSKSGQGAYAYGGAGGPHAATTVGANTNTYDANGNYTGTTAGAVRTVTYNTFDKPLTMTSGSSSTTFTYGPDRDYYKRVDVDNGTTKKTLYLIGVERVYNLSAGTRTDRRYLPGGAYRINNYTGVTSYNVNTSPGTLQSTTVEYLLDDHQGSTDVIADASGNVKQAMSFDAWGMRRNPTTWVAMTTAAGFDNSQTSHGYTGHEMVDNLDIVHMHGRVYDARWGRMLQADPYIQDIGSQAQNRFAYVSNNPLIHTDPTGYMPKCNPETHGGCSDGTQRMLAASPAANGVAGASLFNAALDGVGVGKGGNTSAGGAPSTPAQNQAAANGGQPDGLKGSASKGSPAVEPFTGIREITNPDGTHSYEVGVCGNCTKLRSPTGEFRTSPNDPTIDARFNPRTADMLSDALRNLNRQGIVPVITDGYRSPKKQDDLRKSNSPYVITPARVSWHEAGSAVDFGPNNNKGNEDAIRKEMLDAGFFWGGDFKRTDPPHFQSEPPGTSPTANQVEFYKNAAGGG